MKKELFFVIGLVFFFASCDNKKKQIETAVADSVDSVELTVDTTTIIECDDPPLLSASNESFDDFIYIFAADTSFQLQRIVFPLPYYEEDNPIKIERNRWVHDDLFVKQNYYTLLLDDENELDHICDSTQTSVQVEWIYMKTHLVKKYYFERTNGRWKLEAINQRPILKSKRVSFVDFFIQFATDSLYQTQHINKPLTFVTTDPDDDFSIIETTLDTDQWFAFKPLLPDVQLSNIIYGKEQPDNSQEKILQLKGIGNGFLNTLFFRLKPNDQWELYKFEDTSN